MLSGYSVTSGPASSSNTISVARLPQDIDVMGLDGQAASPCASADVTTTAMSRAPRFDGFANLARRAKQQHLAAIDSDAAQSKPRRHADFDVLEARLEHRSAFELQRCIAEMHAQKPGSYPTDVELQPAGRRFI